MKSESTEYGSLLLNKVPEVTLLFWIIKIMATTVGETGADFLIFNMGFGLEKVSYLMTGVLAAAIFLQFYTKKYVPWVYWVAVVLVSIVGTLITDSLVDIYAISLEATTLFFSIALAATFAVWYASERTLSIQTIYSRKRELFYWAAILFTFALGTAAGDLASEGWGLGYEKSGLIFAGLIALVAVGHYLFNLNAVLSFWVAYILTRPLGASFGDYLSQPGSNGGLGLGTIHTSEAFLVVIVIAVGYLTLFPKTAAKT